MILGAIGVLITAVAGAIVTLRRVDAVHKIVNQQRTDMLTYQKTLIEALITSGIHVPRDQSLDKE